MGVQTDIGSKTYEIRLIARGKTALIFVTASREDGIAIGRARALLSQHDEMDRAEVWRGMKLICSV